MSIIVLINKIREQQDGLTAEERMGIWRKIMEGYCPDCGDVQASGCRCYCKNDE